MKRLHYKTGCTAVLLIALYLLGIFSGSFVVSSIPIFFQQRAFLVSRARAIAEEYLDGRENTVNDISGRNMGIFIFDANENCTLLAATKNLTASGITEQIQQKYLPDVLAGEEKYRPISLGFQDLNLLTGVPIRNGDAIAGAVFLVKMQVDIQGSLLGFLIYFSIFYWLSVYLFVIYLRKKRKLERVQQNYIANVTHALKSPIAAVKTLVETLCDVENLDTTTQRIYYGMILQELNQQSHTVQEILELSKLQSRERDFSKKTTNVVEIFTPVLEKYSMLCECARITFQVSDNLYTLPPLYTNASCIGQVLEILLENALKYTNEGCKIEINAAPSANQITFCVRDNGAGISSEDLPYVFDRFYRCNRNKSGSGLGLAIAKEIVAGLNEKLWAESDVGTGTSFFFTVQVKC